MFMEKLKFLRKILVILFLPSLGFQLALADTVHLGVHIQYDTAMSHVRKKDYPILDILKKTIEILPNSKILIAGHTDTVGRYEVNVELSKGRAEILKRLLVQRGVAAEKIQTKWFSYDAPIASNDTEEGRLQNRRVVVSFYGLTPGEAKGLAFAAEKSNRFKVISVESDQVTEYVAEVLEPKLPERDTASETPETLALVDKQLGQEFEKNKITDEQSDEMIEDDEFIDPSASNDKITGEQSNSNKASEEKEKSGRSLASEPVENKIVEAKPPGEPKGRYYLTWAITDNELVAERSGFQAHWITDFNQTIAAGYQYKMSKSYWLGASGSYRIQNFRSVDSQIYTWDDVTPNLLRAAVNLDYEPSSLWTFGFDLNYSEESFVLTQGLDVSLRKVGLIGSNFRTSYKFYESGSYRSRVKFILDQPFSGSDAIDPKGRLGYMMGADFVFKNFMKNYELNLGAIYGVRNFENIQNTQSENFFNLEFTIRNKKWL